MPTDVGITHGEGFALQFDYGIFTGAFAFSHSYNASHDPAGLFVTDERTVGTLMADLHPGNFRFRGAASFLSRAKGNDVDTTPPIGQNEFDTELTAGYRIVDGLVVSLGYRGAYGAGPANHMAFLGLATSFQGTVPFSR